MNKCHALEGLRHNADNVGSGSAFAGAGKAQDQGSSHAEENKEDGRVDIGNKESEIRQQQENIRRSTCQVRRSANLRTLLRNNEKRD